jgi:hypothetical protein
MTVTDPVDHDRRDRGWNTSGHQGGATALAEGGPGTRLAAGTTAVQAVGRSRQTGLGWRTGIGS